MLMMTVVGDILTLRRHADDVADAVVFGDDTNVVLSGADRVSAEVDDVEVDALTDQLAVND
eukprot:scaffold398_cov198-Alexandrium_tamarense.AAC.5